jgi:predicted outer membrane repeat protein
VDGGGLYHSSIAVAASLDRTTISGNTASGDGGGIASSSFLTVSNSTLSGNTAAGSGGGLAVGGDRTELAHVTISNNSAARRIAGDAQHHRRRQFSR